MIEIASEQLSPRNLEEVVSDRLLLLFLIYENRLHGNAVEGKNEFERQLKLQKLLFKTEELMDKDDYKGLNYNFVRWDHGPFAIEIYMDSEDLIKTNFLERINNEIKLTEKGSKLISNLLSFFKSDKDLNLYLDRAIRQFGEYDANELKVIIKKFPSKSGISIKELKKGTPILIKRDEDSSKRVFKIPAHLFEELIIEFNPDMQGRLKNGLLSVRSSHLRKFRPVIRK
ncbi:MAG: DUF4065 domain-containing protein [Candidatus Bathyarchaeota archaeon]|nr:DUF4065 domain-containing protein [Candidatus Bathyarchaeota archaeon]